MVYQRRVRCITRRGWVSSGSNRISYNRRLDKIYPINKCVLMDNYCNKVRNAIYNYAVEHKLSFYDIREQHGLLRDIMMTKFKHGRMVGACSVSL